MVKNVKLENELYEPMKNWLQEYLEDKYRTCQIITQDTSEIDLDVALQYYNLNCQFPKAVGLHIQIDILGIIIGSTSTKLAFIEAKKNQLTTHNLGQLLVYCRLMDPAEAFLMSSLSMGSLDKILVNLNRKDILKYGKNNEKSIHVSTWNVLGKHPDMGIMVPSLYQGL